MSTNGQNNDRLDTLLREWHEQNAARAALGRDRLVASLAGEEPKRADTFRGVIHTLFMGRYARAAASLVLAVGLVALLLPQTARTAHAATIVQVAEGGRLDAFHGGRVVGPCPLEHTDVAVEIAGRFTRVTLQQRYRNPYDRKIEAAYTFPLSHRGAVDRMTMTVGDRIVVGEVKQRDEAKAVYEAAKASGYVAGLLEQERPNVFTQSIANIEPDAEIVVEISYVEVLESRDGTWSFDFPMVVGPRYVPGRSLTSRAVVPAELTPRHGIILRGPASLELGDSDTIDKHGALHAGQLQALLDAAQPIEMPGEPWLGRGEDVTIPDLWHPFVVRYSEHEPGEVGMLYADGTGNVNGRWFFTDPRLVRDLGTGYAADTTSVPDASRITPMPVRPPTRAGHDVSVTVSIDTGGPAITGWTSKLHDVAVTGGDDAEGRLTFALENDEEIPNRDFVLEWTLADDAVQPSHFAHAGEHGGFFTLMLDPPARVDDDRVVPRELIFVLDRSGSMKGHPIEKARQVMTRAIDAMRDRDTFNVITFAAETSTLWPAPKPATAENRAAARAFVESHEGDGGTEMLKAITAALAPTPTVHAGVERRLTPEEVANLPADGREVRMRAAYDSFHGGERVDRIRVREGLVVPLRLADDLPPVLTGIGVEVDVDGTWNTVDGRRVLDATRAVLVGKVADAPAGAGPLRIVMFLTDGYVGNDAEIIAAVREHARTTRVFGFGIGDSLNRHLMDEMSKAGRGAVEYVVSADGADEVVARFCTRIATPVLSDIEVEFSDGLEITDTVPPLDSVADLFDERPIIVHGRYTKPGAGTVTVRGRTGAGRYERTLDVELPEAAADHDVIATLWARAQVDELTKVNDANGITKLGEQFSIVTKYTSFVAVERSRMTVEGRSMLVPVPIELPQNVSWEGNFGGRRIEDAEAGDLAGGEGYDTFGAVFGEAGPGDATRATLGRDASSGPTRGVESLYRYKAPVPAQTAEGRVPIARHFELGDSLGSVEETQRQVTKATSGYGLVQQLGRQAPDAQEALALGVHPDVAGVEGVPITYFAPPSEPATLHLALQHEVIRNAVLERVLDPRLWFVVGTPESLPGTPLLVSLLISDTKPETLQALSDGGLEVLDRNGRHVVGRITPDRLATLALLETVRRVEAVVSAPRRAA